MKTYIKPETSIVELKASTLLLDTSLNNCTPEVEDPYNQFGREAIIDAIQDGIVDL